jgi:hypothetical protein
MADIIQIRRGLASQWTSTNPVLADGELGFERDTKKGKLGDGVTAWNSLPYSFTGESSNLAEQITAAAVKTTPVDADNFGITDSAASNALKKLSWANIKASLNTLYAGISHVHSTADITSGTLGIIRGGTGLSSLGTANQLLRVNAGATALEYFTPSFLTTAITSLNGLTASVQTFANDTNVTITSATSTHTIGWTGQLAVSRGGTGASTLTGVLIGNGTSAVTAVAGTASQLLRRNAGNTAYEFFTIAGSDITGAALTASNDTNVTITLGGTPATSLLRAASITLGWTGTLSVARGGTGISSYTTGNYIRASGATTLEQRTPAQVLADLGAGYLGVPQNSQSAAYTLVLDDAGKHIFHPSADTTARTWTIPANSSVAFPIGTAITFVNQNGAGVITIAITTDTMRLAGAGTTGSRTLAANGIATALKVTSTEWIISGTNLT